MPFKRLSLQAYKESEIAWFSWVPEKLQNDPMKLLGTILLLPISFCSANSKVLSLQFLTIFFNATMKPPTYSIQNLFPLGGNTQPQWFALTPLSMLDKRIRQHELRVSQYNNNPT